MLNLNLKSKWVRHYSDVQWSYDYIVWRNKDNIVLTSILYLSTEEWCCVVHILLKAPTTRHIFQLIVSQKRAHLAPHSTTIAWRCVCGPLSVTQNRQKTGDMLPFAHPESPLSSHFYTRSRSVIFPLSNYILLSGHHCDWFWVISRESEWKKKKITRNCNVEN